jgi:uncharacterized protein (TIGR00290 family)
MIRDGHEPVCLLVTYNDDAGRSWFHGIHSELLTAVAEQLELPLIECHTSGADYHLGLEDGLKKAAALGAEACVFGDIDIEEHLEWNKARCARAGLKCILPLWHEDREKLVYETIDAGIRAVIKCVESKWLSDDFLGKVLDRNLVDQIRRAGSDICGENGEYHTFVYDGPMFKSPVAFNLGEVIDFGDYSVIDIQ